MVNTNHGGDRRWVVAFFLVGGVACSARPGGGGGGGATPPQPRPVTDIQPDPVAVPGSSPAVVAENPTRPRDDAGGELGWTEAPLLEGVGVIPNRDSVILTLPAVPGAADFRVFALPAGLRVEDHAGFETLTGATVFCAGYRQHNAPRPAKRALLRQVEVTGLFAAQRLVVEAVDASCPFTGVMGLVHQDVVVDSPEVPPEDNVPFSVFTEAELRARDGNLVLNGHGPGSTLAAPAALEAPIVVARTTVNVTPLGTAALPAGVTFFDDFAAADQPTLVGAVPEEGRTQFARLYQNDLWSFYTYDAEASQMFVDRGQLHFILADWAQDVMSTNVAYPRRPVQLSATRYLHVHFEVATNATARRYWWVVLCGAEQTGGTMEADGRLKGSIIQTPFFMNADGRNPSVESWNCLQVFPRDGWPFALPPDNTAPQTEVRVMVNAAGVAERDSVVDVSPPMYSAAVGPPSWYRQRDAAGNLVAPILDDQQLISPNTRYDLFIRRDRVVMYVNGEQRLCNDFPAHALTMAEGALGFGQVYYHSTAERLEFAASFWDRRGQRYYLENTPYVDHRAWDNLGFGEDVDLPGGIVGAFDDAPCYRP